MDPECLVRVERRAGCLPEPLRTFLERTAIPALAQGAPAVWSKRGADATLEVSFVPFSGAMGKARWMLVFDERSHAAPMPAAWKTLLTPREQEVAAAVLRGLEIDSGDGALLTLARTLLRSPPATSTAPRVRRRSSSSASEDRSRP